MTVDWKCWMNCLASVCAKSWFAHLSPWFPFKALGGFIGSCGFIMSHTQFLFATLTEKYHATKLVRGKLN